MSVLVTGGAGFIGSHLCEELAKKGKMVICLDNFDSYYNPQIKKENIRALLKNKNFRVIRGDIRNRSFLTQVFRKHNVSKIVHLAAKVGVRASLKDPFSYQETNIKGTLFLLELARKYDVKNFVFGSSSSVYGEVPTPFKEEGPTNPISPYGATKLCGETLVRTYSELYGISSCALRFFTVYGPRQRPDMAIYKFTKLMLQNKPLPVYGHGRLKRDYTYVKDIIKGIIKSLNKKWKFEVINLGSSRPVELKIVLKLIQQHLKIKAKIKYLPKPPGDVFITFADISKARKLLGYEPQTPLEEGIKKFIDWIQQNSDQK